MPIGTFVLQVFASDIDSEQLVYQITVNYIHNGMNTFYINSTSGQIKTNAPINREISPAIVRYCYRLSCTKIYLCSCLVDSFMLTGYPVSYSINYVMFLVQYN